MPKVEFIKQQAAEYAVVKRLLAEERDDQLRRAFYLQETHSKIRAQVNRGMSRSAAGRIWGDEMVKDALDADGVATAVAAE